MQAHPTVRARAIALALLLLVIVLALPSSAFASRTLGLSSGVFKFDVKAGSVATGVAVVSNDGTERLNVLVYAGDQAVDSKGNVTYSVPTAGVVTTAPSSWAALTLPPNTLPFGEKRYMVIKPGEHVPVKFAFTVPPDIPSGDHTVLVFFETFDLPQPGQALQSKVSGRIGARVTLRVNGPIIQKIYVEPFTVPAIVFSGDVPYAFGVHNVGNVDVRIGARSSLVDPLGNIAAQKIAADGHLVFAGTNYETTGTLTAEKLLVGPCRLRLEVVPVDDNGNAINPGTNTIYEVRDVWVLPWWFIITVGVILVILIGLLTWWLLRRSSRRRSRSAEAASS